MLLRAPASTSTKRPDLNATELRIYDALAAGPKAVADLEATLGLTRPNLRKALRSLRSHGLVRQDGGKGRSTTYRQLPNTTR